MQDRKNKCMTLEEAVSHFVHDGCSVAFSGIASREPVEPVMRSSVKAGRTSPLLRIHKPIQRRC